MQQQEFLYSAARTAAIAFGPLLLLGFVWFILRRPAPRSEELTPQQVKQLAAAKAMIPAAAAAQMGAIAMPQLTAEVDRRERMRQQIHNLAQENPSMLAQLMQAWMEEDR